jgi:23S rRNA pseudouridine1911/1915/1917 synthase
MILQYIIKNKDKEKTINQIIQNNFKLSTRLFYKLVRNKKILLNNTIVDTRGFADCGDVITIDLNYEEDNSNIVATQMELEILYEDDGMLILNKPAGVPVHPSMSHYENSLSNGVKFYFDTIGLHKKLRPVNRLDLDTSGIIIFAKNEFIQEHLIRQMMDGTFKKEYLAVVCGHFDNKQGTIDAPIARKENSIIERCVSEDGKKAITQYEVLQEFENLSLVKCKLLTGRTHQIRVHMAYIGHPLLGDTMYGKPSNLINRQALHSFKISFIHPVTYKPFELHCDLPSDIKKIIHK